MFSAVDSNPCMDKSLTIALDLQAPTPSKHIILSDDNKQKPFHSCTGCTAIHVSQSASILVDIVMRMCMEKRKREKKYKAGEGNGELRENDRKQSASGMRRRQRVRQRKGKKGKTCYSVQQFYFGSASNAPATYCCCFSCLYKDWMLLWLLLLLPPLLL